LLSYDQAEDYLIQALPSYQRIGSAAYKKDLNNTLALCEALDNPQHKFKSIHVGGTNGKGSVSSLLAAVFTANGYKTGLYTSPHLLDFTERVRINGKNIPKLEVVRFVEEYKELLESVKPSFFEMTVAMAFDFFAREKVDIAIIEVGLGGRLDSTNVIDPILSVITNISFDHADILGNTLESIAGEKAGIIKKNRPVVIGRIQNETIDVFKKKANETDSELIFAQEKCSVKLDEERFILSENESEKVFSFDSFSSGLRGKYQEENLATVLTTIAELKKLGFVLNDSEVLLGLEKVNELSGLRGRFEIIQQNPLVILDVAHNEDGLKNLFAQVLPLVKNKLIVVFGVSKEKNIDSILPVLPLTADYCFVQANLPRALNAEELSQSLTLKAGFTGFLGGTVADGMKKVLDSATSEDVILVCGSLFVVAEAMHFLDSGA
jgi:dihydrofolate synthase/folylpolyglutamate synthase